MRGRRRGLTPLMSLTLLGASWGGVAYGQSAVQGQSPSFQLEHFEPLADPTINILNVAAPDVPDHLRPSAGVICHHAHQPVVLVPAEGEALEAIESQSRCEVVGGVGLFGVASLEVALPVVVRQQAPAPEIFNLTDQDFDGVVAGDLRVMPKVRLFAPIGGFSAAVATPLYFPTGDGKTFNSGGGLRMEPQLIAGWRSGAWQIAGSVGHQLQNPMRLHNVELDDATRWRVGARAPLGWSSLRAFAVAFGSVSSGDSRDPAALNVKIRDGRGSPAEALGGLEYQWESGVMLRLGGGHAISDGLGAPGWRALAAVDWVGVGGPYVPAPWRPPFSMSGPNITSRWRLLIEAPTFVGGVGPFAYQRRAVQSPEAVYSVDSAQVGDPADLTFTLELGQGAVGVADGPEATRVALGLAVAVLDDLELSVQVPALFGDEADLKGPPVSLGPGGGLPPEDLPDEARADAPSGQGGALGDIALRIKALAIDGAEHPVGAGLVIPITLPTGSEDAVSTGRLRLGTVGVGELHVGGVDLRTNLGAHIEDDVEDGQPLGAIIETGVGAVWHPAPRWHIGGELFGEHPLDDLWRPRAFGGAALGGRSLPRGLSWAMGAKVSRLLSEVTQVDLLLRISWGTAEDPPPVVVEAPPPPPPPAPVIPAVITPPPDPDGDGITAGDQCPQAPEDKDGFQDGDGCPEPDNDGDGLLDAEDRCPNTQGIRQWEGCNDIAITVAFPFKSVTPAQSARGTLTEMVGIIESNPQILHIVVEGHTDDVGTNGHNQRLSERRAQAVRTLLVEAGVPEDMISAVGYGEARPRVSVEGLEGEVLRQARDRNRRVRFVLTLTEEEGEAAP